MADRRVNFGATIALNMAPIAANAVAGALLAILKIDHERVRCITDDERLWLVDAVERIDLQLEALSWPRGRRKAPFPI